MQRYGIAANEEEKYFLQLIIIVTAIYKRLKENQIRKRNWFGLLMGFWQIHPIRRNTEKITVGRNRKRT